MIENPELYEVRVELSKGDRDLILKHCPAREMSIVEPFRVGAFEGKRLVFRPRLPALQELVRWVEFERRYTEPRTLRRRFERLYLKLREQLEEIERGIRKHLASGVDERREAFDEELRERLAEAGVENIDDAKRELQRLQDEYNHRPMPDFGGLSPEQMRRLLYMRDWSDPENVLFVNPGLSEEDVCGTPVIANARMFLGALREQDGTAATVAGNLNRKFVRHVFDRFTWFSPFIADLRRKHTRYYNEQDFWELHLHRILLEMAGYVRKNKKRFVATKRADEVFERARVGGAFAHLFHTLFKKLNLDYVVLVYSELPEVQQEAAYSFYRVGQLADDWILKADLAPEILAPPTRAMAVDDDYSEDYQIEAAADRILGPLVNFGLLERRVESGEETFETMDQFRKTPLFDKLLTFRI